MSNDNKAYIGIEREENSLQYIAKVLGEPPREITKMQYNAIVKALGAQDWRNTDDDEAKIISRIITNSLTLDEGDFS